METGTQIMLLREAKGLSREFIADELKMHVNTYKNIEYGKKIPTLKEIEKIAELLEVEPSVFLSADKTTIIRNIRNSPGTGTGNTVINDATLVKGLTTAIEKLTEVITDLKSGKANS